MRRTIAPVLIAILALSALASSTHGETTKVGLSRLLGYPAVPIGLERGYFKAQGLDVEMVFFDRVRPFLIAYRRGLKDFHDAFIAADGKRQDSASAPAMVKRMEDFTGASKDEIERTIPYVAPEGAIDAHSIDTQSAWYKSQNLIKSDIKAADIIDPRYAILLPSP